MNSLERDVWDVSWTVVEMTSWRTSCCCAAPNIGQRGFGPRVGEEATVVTRVEDANPMDDEDFRTAYRRRWQHRRQRPERQVPLQRLPTRQGWRALAFTGRPVEASPKHPARPGASCPGSRRCRSGSSGVARRSELRALDGVPKRAGGGNTASTAGADPGRRMHHAGHRREELAPSGGNVGHGASELATHAPNTLLAQGLRSLFELGGRPSGSSALPARRASRPRAVVQSRLEASGIRAWMNCVGYAAPR